MASIGFYDIDLWHRGKSVPNLELMKTYNYLYQQGNKVTMMKPTDEIGRFNHIMYFKDNINVDIPNHIEVTGENKSFYGYGFYGYTIPLKPEIAAVPPVFTPYDAYATKLSVKAKYDQIKRNSLIRFETKDFTYMQPKSRKIFFVDHNLFEQEGIDDFLQEHKNQTFEFLHTQFIRDEESALKFMRYTDLFSQPFVISYNFSEDFFYEYFKEDILFDIRTPPYDDNYLTKFIKIGLWYKKTRTVLRISVQPDAKPEEKEFFDLVFEWIKSPKPISYYEYFKDNKQAIRYADSRTSEIRLLLKQNPDKVTKESLKLYKNLKC